MKKLPKGRNLAETSSWRYVYTTKSKGGVDLQSLTDVQNIVEAHKGRVWAESAGSGKGSQFYVELPGA